MPRRCFVKGCPSYDDDLGLSFFRLPSCRDNTRQINPIKQKKLIAWLKALNLDANSLTLGRLRNSRICSKHFVSGRPSDSINDRDWAPTLNLKPNWAQSLESQSGVSMNHLTAPCSFIIIKSDLRQPQTGGNDFSFENGPLDIKADIELQESDINQSFEEGSEYCETLLKENKRLKEEVKRLTKLIDELKQELLLSRHKEIKFEQIVLAVKDLVNEDIQTAAVKQEI